MQLVRKQISPANEDGIMNWYLLVISSAMRGFHHGEATSVADAENQMDAFLDTLNTHCEAT